MKLSWRYKMILLMLVAVIGAISVTWVLNRTFLEDYYLYSKLEVLHNAYEMVDSIILLTEKQNESNSMEFSEESEFVNFLF